MDTSFLGVIGSGTGATGPGGKGGLFQTYSYVLGGSKLSLWSRAPSSCCAGLGVLLTGRVFGHAERARELGVEAANESVLLLQAYRKWGAEFPKHVYGDYAFVLWDVPSQRLLLGRDAVGSWPLYYTQRDNDLIFASEIRRLLHWPGVVARPNERHIARWLALFPEPTNETFFDGIFRLPPGTTLSIEAGRTSVCRFWQPEKTPPLRLRDSGEYAEGLLETLDRAVQDRLTGTSAVGSQLSGGLDSSSVTVTAARLLSCEGRRLFAFTAVPEYIVEVPNRFTDEGPHAAAVVAMYPNVDHVLVRHGAHSPFSVIDLFNSAQEEPIFNPWNYDWTYEICLRAQRLGIATLLIGQVGNLSVSYSGDRALQSLLREGRLAFFARIAWDLHRQGSRRWRSLVYELLRPWMPMCARYAIDRLRGQFAATHEYSMIRREFARKHDLGPMTMERALAKLDSRAFRLLSLRRSDLGPSASAFRQLTGVGMSDPTGDRRVIEYCLSVPVEYYCENGVSRSLIRNAMIGRLPEQVRTERRRGLQAADFGTHFEAERAEALAELERMRQVDLIAHALDLPAIETMIHLSASQADAHCGMVGGHWPKLLRALSLGRFLRRLEDGTLFPVPERMPGMATPADECAGVLHDIG
ncbi:MAG TPA: asparagine synthase-related protein [Terriglobales bacterium]|nr:asparagine synthase-related protein [Terriglobales bacterium]